ncbi:UNVERIFIED_CONTAM: hypothetical protein FKN15_005866 [Acipenser sinensis]
MTSAAPVRKPYRKAPPQHREIRHDLPVFRDELDGAMAMPPSEPCQNDLSEDRSWVLNRFMSSSEDMLAFSGNEVLVSDVFKGVPRSGVLGVARRAYPTHTSATNPPLLPPPPPTPRQQQLLPPEDRKSPQTDGRADRSPSVMRKREEMKYQTRDSLERSQRERDADSRSRYKPTAAQMYSLETNLGPEQQEMEDARLRVLQQQNEDLRQRLTYTTHKMEAMETEFESSQHYMEAEMGRTKDELEKMKDKFRRLQNSYTASQRTNQDLEDKLHALLRRVENDKKTTDREIVELTNKLLDAKNTIDKLEELNERYRQDCNLAVQLLKCNKSHFRNHKFADCNFNDDMNIVSELV